MIAHGAKVEWSPSEVKKEGRGGAAAAAAAGGRGNVGKTPVMVAMTGGRGAAFAAGPGFGRLGPPPFREASNREPLEAVKVLLAAGADPNVKAPDGSTPLHQAVQARQVEIIRALVAAGAKLDAVNKDNLTPLLLAEKPEPPPPPGNNNDPDTYKPKTDTREEVIAALRELMRLGPDDPAPVPPPPRPTTRSRTTRRTTRRRPTMTRRRNESTGHECGARLGWHRGVAGADGDRHARTVGASTSSGAGGKRSRGAHRSASQAAAPAGAQSPASGRGREVSCLAEQVLRRLSQQPHGVAGRCAGEPRGGQSRRSAAATPGPGSACSGS